MMCGYVYIYWYEDDSESIYFSELKVEPEFRKQGVGNKLLNLIEEISRILNRTKIYLWVEENTWQHKWYKRKGYNDYPPHQSNIFMKINNIFGWKNH